MASVNKFLKINNCNEKYPGEDPDWNTFDPNKQTEQYRTYETKCKTAQIPGCSEKYPPGDENQWNSMKMIDKLNLYGTYRTKCDLNEKYDTLRDLQSKSCIQKYQQHNSKFLLIGLLIELYRKNDLPPSDNYYRSLLHALHEYKLIDFGVECNKTVQIIGNSKQLGKESMSITVQWLDIQPNSLTDFLKITVNKKKCDELLDNFFTYFGFNDSSVPFKSDFEENEPRAKVAALYTKFSDLILKTIEKLKKNFFLKLGPTTLIESQEQLKSEREVYFYKLLTNYVFNHNTPHIATHIYSNECLNFADIQGLNISTKDGSVPIKDFFSKTKELANRDLDGFILLMTENMAPSIPLIDFVSKFYEKDMTADNSQEHIKDMKQIIFQVFYTLYIFYGMNFVHDDLHLGNIMIETLNKEFDYYYIIGDQPNAYKVVQLKTKYFVRIYDFDLSYILFDGQYDKYIRGVNKLQLKFEKRLDEKNEDFDFFIKRLAKLYQNPSESDNKKLFDIYKTKNILSDTNKIATRDATYKEINNFIKIYEQSKKSTMFMILKWMDVISDNDQPFKIYNSLKEIPLTNESKIFFPQTIDIDKFSVEISANPQWNTKSFFEKIIMCHSFVGKNESAAIQKDFKSLTLQGGGDAGTNSDYHYKYLKYKHKYHNIKNGLNNL